jgi:hypothetical protein
MNLDAFLVSKDRNAWIDEKYMKVYVRRSMRLIGPDTVPCLDLATVEVDEDKRGGGVLTLFIKRFEREAKKLNRAVYVESILEPRLIPFLIKNGYAFVPMTCMDGPSLYKIPA